MGGHFRCCTCKIGLPERLTFFFLFHQHKIQIMLYVQNRAWNRAVQFFTSKHGCCCYNSRMTYILARKQKVFICIISVYQEIKSWAYSSVLFSALISLISLDSFFKSFQQLIIAGKSNKVKFRARISQTIYFIPFLGLLRLTNNGVSDIFVCST